MAPPPQLTATPFVKGDYTTYTDAQLQEEHSRRRRQLNGLGVGAVASIAAAPVSGGTSLFSLVWPAVRGPYVEKQFKRLEEELARRGVPKLSRTKRDYIVPLVAGGTSFLVGGMADGLSYVADAAMDHGVGAAAAVIPTSGTSGLNAFGDGLAESAGNLEDALRDVRGAASTAADAYQSAYADLDTHLEHAADKVADTVHDPAVLASPQFLAAAGQGSFSAISGELVSRGAEGAMRPLGGGPSRVPPPGGGETVEETKRTE